jgi:hypothetical protein
MADDEQRDEETTEAGGSGQETRVTNPIVDPHGDTSESPAVDPEATGRDVPEGTGPGGSIRGGYGLGATGPEGDRDVRGPADTGTGGAAGGVSPLEAQRRGEDAQDDFAQRPHLYVAGAFLGGLVVAQLLKRMGSDD